MLTREDVLEVYNYSRDEGVFYRKKAWRNLAAGSMVGCENEKGYLRTRVKGKTYRVHRLIWLVEHGAFPVLELDHRDGNPSNNKITNLRCVTPQQNQQNRKGAKGYYKVSNGFRVDLYFKGKKKIIGIFKTEQEARQAYVEAKNKYYEGYVYSEN